MSPGGAFICVGLLSIGLGMFVLYHHRGTTGATTFFKVISTTSPGITLILVGLVAFTVGLMRLSSGSSSPSAEAAERPSRQTEAPALPPASPTEPRPRPIGCCETSCKNGVSCVPCNVEQLPWQVRVTGIGYKSEGTVVDLGHSPEWSNVKACVYEAQGAQAGGCVSLEAAVRSGGAAVANLPSFSTDELAKNGLSFRVLGTRNGQVEELAGDVKRLQVSAKNVCRGYQLFASSGAFVSLFLVDASAG